MERYSTEIHKQIPTIWWCYISNEWTSTFTFCIIDVEFVRCIQL